MSKGKKTVLIAAAVLILVGTAIAVISASVGGWDRIKNANETFTDKTYEVSEKFDAITVESVSSRIYILPTDGAARVVCSESEHLTHRVDVSGGRLKITEKIKNSWIRIGWASDTPEIKVYLPETEYKSIEITGASGNVDIPSDFTFEKVDLKLASGAISCKAQVNGSMSAESVSGEITLNNLDGDKLNVKTVSGRLIVSYCAVKTVKIYTTSGDADFKNTACGQFTAETVSGDILFGGVIVEGEVRVKGTSGDVKIKIAE